MQMTAYLHRPAKTAGKGNPAESASFGFPTAYENLLSAFALMIGGALAIGLPMALVIVWICS